MDTKIKQKHSKETFLFALSKILERASFYGFRSLILLYMVGETLKIQEKEALGIYGWFVATITLSQIIGAIVGDLLIGNKKTIFIGGILQSIGAFTLCIPSTPGLYIGLSLTVIGSGMYSPNIISKFGKLYLHKTKLLDAAFTIFYLAINIGSFIGVLVIVTLGEKYGWNTGFIAAGITILLSLLPLILSKDKEFEVIEKSNFNLSKRIRTVSILLILTSIYWYFYNLGDFHFYELELEFHKMQTLNIPFSIWKSVDSLFGLVFSIILIVLWSIFFKSYLFKITIGFISLSLSFAFLSMIPSQPMEFHIVYLIISILFLSISEIIFSPIIYSVLTKYANPKYLTILISFAFIPISLFNYIFIKTNVIHYEDTNYSTILILAITVIISIALIVFKRVKK